MPGPLAGNRTHRSAAPNTPHRKVAARLAARQAEFDQRVSLGNQTPGGAKIVPMLTKPGSQNRKK